MCYCEGIEYFISNVFRVSHFVDGPLGLVSQTPAHLDQCILHGAEESLFWGKHTCSLFTTSLRIKRGVICAAKTFCSRVIDPEKSNLWISCQLYRTVPNPLTKEESCRVYNCDDQWWASYPNNVICYSLLVTPFKSNIVTLLITFWQQLLVTLLVI